jgi:hypothetical protein
MYRSVTKVSHHVSEINHLRMNFDFEYARFPSQKRNISDTINGPRWQSGIRKRLMYIQHNVMMDSNPSRRTDIYPRILAIKKVHR